MLQFVANGLVLGSIIAVTAVGLTIIYGILRLINFAHGDMVTLGAYTAWFFNANYQWHPLHSIPAAIVVGAAVAMATERLIWRRMRRMKAGIVSLIVASIGLALVMRHALVFYFGTGLKSFRIPVQRAMPIADWLPVRLTPNQVTIVIVSGCLVLGLHLLLRYTRIGKSLRAMSDNLDLAWVCGVNVNRLVLWAWAIGGGLAATGGVLFAMMRPVYPELGWHLLLAMFAAIIVGGIRNPYGAIAGGVFIGVIQETSVFFGVPAQYKIAVGFAALIVALFVRPYGIFGEREYR